MMNKRKKEEKKQNKNPLEVGPLVPLHLLPISSNSYLSFSLTR